MSLSRQIVSASDAAPHVSLVRYDAACRAIADAKSVDEVKELRDRAEALRAYARLAKNHQLEIDAAEIRMRAERRLGEMIAGQKATVGLNAGTLRRGADEEPRDLRPTLADAGIDKKLSARAQKMAAVPEQQFEEMVGEWRGRVEAENERVTTNLLRAGEREQERRENDFYPTFQSLIAEVKVRWKPRAKVIWEPCEGDGRVVNALRSVGYEVVAGDIAQGQNFFDFESSPQTGIALCTNPPFESAREFIDHAFAIGIREMCLVLPERFWASGIGREQFERHRPAAWINLDWRDDYLGKGGSPDRALAVAIWDGPCAPRCDFDVWTREPAGQISNSSGTSSRQTDMADVGSPPPASAALSSVSSVGVADEIEDKTPHVSIGGAPEVAAPPLAETGDESGEQTGGDRVEIKRTPLRPHCLNPDLCASGGGTKHCHRCTVAAGLAVAA